MAQKEDQAKRKAEDMDIDIPSPSKRSRASPHSDDDDDDSSHTKQARSPTTPRIITFPEKPAVIEERQGEIEFRVVNNDGKKDSTIIMTGLKCIFQKQLPKMPKDYIARLVYDRTHISIAIVKKPLEVVGGITYRPFKGRQFAEIVFCAISSDQQVKGYGAHLMNHLKDYVKATSDVMHFLTYADNYAIGYFKKQGFTKEITLEKRKWMGYIKDYEGGTIMQCSMVPKIRYLEAGRMLMKQKECVAAKIRAVSKSHIVHQPPEQWKTGICKIDPMSIPAIKASGWSPDMDELARAPKHGPNYNQLLHLLNDMQNNTNAWPFQQPVNKDDVADYYDVIKEPMDLATMEEKHEKDLYPTPEDFVRDARLIFNNCRKYNNESTPYAKAANRLEKFMWGKIKEVPEWSVLASQRPVFHYKPKPWSRVHRNSPVDTQLPYLRTRLPTPATTESAAPSVVGSEVDASGETGIDRTSAKPTILRLVVRTPPASSVIDIDDDDGDDGMHVETVHCEDTDGGERRASMREGTPRRPIDLTLPQTQPQIQIQTHIQNQDQNQPRISDMLASAPEPMTQTPASIPTPTPVKTKGRGSAASRGGRGRFRGTGMGRGSTLKARSEYAAKVPRRLPRDSGAEAKQHKSEERQDEASPGF